nr:lipase family protein [Nitrosomonas sp. Nm58]
MLVAFRGTEPDDLKDWLTDAQFDLTDGSIKNIKNKVHRGFHEALNAAWPQLEGAIADLRTHNQAIWVTGHSLGAALATLAVARLSLGDGVRSQESAARRPGPLHIRSATHREQELCNGLRSTAQRTIFQVRE